MPYLVINLSEAFRNSEDFSLWKKVKDNFDYEIYRAESIRDFRENKHLLYPPFLKRNPIYPNDDCVLIYFYNVGIEALYEDDRLIPNRVAVHDRSGGAVMCWTRPGEILPARDDYISLLERGTLKPKDWVYRLDVRYYYPEDLPFVADVQKTKFNRPVPEKKASLEKIISLFPQPEALPV